MTLIWVGGEWKSEKSLSRMGEKVLLMTLGDPYLANNKEVSLLHSTEREGSRPQCVRIDICLKHIVGSPYTGNPYVRWERHALKRKGNARQATRAGSR